MLRFCALFILMIIFKPQKVPKIEILRVTAKNFARRQMNAALGVSRLRRKFVPLEKVQAMQIIRKIFTKKELYTERLFKIINNIC